MDALGTGDWGLTTISKRRVKIVSAMICTLPCCAFHFSPKQTTAENGTESSCCCGWKIVTNNKQINEKQLEVVRGIEAWTKLNLY